MGIIISKYIINKRKEKKLKSPNPPTCVHQTQPQETTAENKNDPGHVVGSEREGSDSHQSGEAKTAPGNEDQTQPCQICREEQLAARRYRIRLIAGIFFPFTLSALDSTIIASALPWIASDFNQISQMNWIVSAFNLCSAAFIPFWGQLADIFGRTITLELVLFLMLLGSALCTAAPTTAFPMLILGRAIQGLSVAGINISTKIIMADKVSLKENAKNNSLFALFAGISYAIGRVIGGYLTDKDWRWCFGINLPVAFAGMIMVFFILRPELLGPQPLPELEAAGDRTQRFKARMATIDYGGQFLFLSGMALIILALTWGGATYDWGDAHVVAPLIIGGILFCCFIAWQALMVPGRYLSRKLTLQKPTLPWKLMSQRNMGLLFYINFATGMAMTAVLYFVDIYFTLVAGFTPSKAGVQLLYYTPGIGVGVGLAVFLCNVYPRQTFTPLLLGSFLEALGITLLAYALHLNRTPLIYGMMGLTGAGTGLRFMPGSLHGIGFFPNNIASVIAMVGFAVPFGGTLAMTIMDTVFNNKSGIKMSGGDESYVDSLGSLPTVAQEMVRDSARRGIVWAFIAILPFMWLCVVAALGLGNVNIVKMRGEAEEGTEVRGGSAEEPPFLVELFRRRFGKEKNRESGKVGGVEMGKVEGKAEVNGALV